MSRSKPTRRLYCSRCKKKHFMAAVCGSPKHFNVVVIGRTDSGDAACRCKTCGYGYVTNSERGRRMAAKLWTAQEARINSVP